MTKSKRIYGDNFIPTFPDDNIRCKDCIFRKPDVVKGNKVIIKGYKNGYCEIYTPEISNGKPNDILFKNAKCEYYKKD